MPFFYDNPAIGSPRHTDTVSRCPAIRKSLKSTIGAVSMQEKSIGDYIVSVLNGMAQGLFASLIIGLIIKQIGVYTGLEWLSTFGQIAQCLTCPAIGIGVAGSIGAKSLALYASAAAGAIGGGAITISEAGAIAITSGEPLGACIAALIAAIAGKWVTGKTKADIIVVPFLTILAGGISGMLISPVAAMLMSAIGAFINHLTTLYPFPMGILVSVVVGMVLTLPISSAAICISLGLSGLAAGAACAGCAAQMVGFAVMSFKENGIGGLISQGLGTSMLQIPNIWKNWKIWIPPTLASAITGPISTCIFKMTNNAAGAGMGTSGLVGQFNAVAVMGAECLPAVFIVHFILPAVFTVLIAIPMRRKGWIKDGDLTLPV